MKTKVLFKMRHGLGDNAQFTIVIRHLRHYRPDWEIDLEIGAGKASFFRSSVHATYWHKKEPCDVSAYDKVFEVKWPIPRTCSPQVPSTKPTRFLQETLELEPLEQFYRGYPVETTEEEEKLAEHYVASLPAKPVVLLHYLATTLKGFKDLKLEQAALVCDSIIAAGCVPVILDWKSESPLPDGKRIFNPKQDNPMWQGSKSSSAGTLAALIKRAKLFIGIDSGPLHVAGATQTPAIGVWRRHHPVNFFDLCDNVTHLVQRGCKVKGLDSDAGRTYFEKRYHYQYYEKLSVALREIIALRLAG